MSCPLCPAALARPRPYSGPAALLRGLGKGLWRRDLLGGGPLAPACCLQSPGPTRASPNHKAHWPGHGGQVASALSHPGAAGRGPTSLPRGRARWAGWGDPGGGSEVYPSPSPQPQASRSPRSRIPGEALGLLGPVRPPALCSASRPVPSRSPSPVRYGMQWSSGSRARRHASRTATSARCSRTVTCGGTGRVTAVREGPQASGWACRGAWRPGPCASPGSPQPKARLSLEPQASSTSQARWEPVWRRPARGQASGPEAACPGRPAPAPP